MLKANFYVTVYWLDILYGNDRSDYDYDYYDLYSIYVHCVACHLVFTIWARQTAKHSTISQVLWWKGESVVLETRPFQAT